MTVVARAGSTRLSQLRRDGAIVNAEGERAAVGILDTLDEQIAYDLVIVTLLTHQVDAVLPGLRRSAARCIQFMFNMFDPERLQQSVGVDRCSFGMPFVQALLTEDGKFKATIGAAGQKTIMGQQRWVDVFNAAGLPATLEADMPLWLRCHAPLCVAFESVSVAGERRKGGASWGEALILAKGLHACFTLIQALGFSIYPGPKKLLNRSPASVVAAALWSMSRIRSFRELLASGRAECRALVDVMVTAGESAQPPVPVSKIKAMKPA